MKYDYCRKLMVKNKTKNVSRKKLKSGQMRRVLLYIVHTLVSFILSQFLLDDSLTNALGDAIMMQTYLENNNN
jgi:hypothetical protein